MSRGAVFRSLIAIAAVSLVVKSQSAAEDRGTHPTVVYVVRHAEKESDTADTDLSKKGHERAATLAWMLRDVPLDAIYSTDTLRTRNTVKPTATAGKLDILTYHPRPGKLAQVIQRELAGKSLLVCGHSNTVPRLLAELGAGIDEKILAGYDDLFIVVLGAHDKEGIRSATLHRMHYPASR
ncbi:MAG: SixA phosphatase family protein [Planctomycetota bacterium]|jgi:phosphohistidine phosphatase SixA